MARDKGDAAKYCERWSGPVPDYLLWLERETHLKTLAPQMMAGRLQGRMLAMLSRMVNPSSVLEIGTFTGYSALCLAEGLREGGGLITIEANDELEWLIRKGIARSPFAEQIECIIGKAEEILPELDVQPDLVFLDAGKQDYRRHYEHCLGKMKKGAFMLVDNTLWSGKVYAREKDADALAIHEFNRMVFEDERTRSLILPIRDGISCIEKIR